MTVDVKALATEQNNPRTVSIGRADTLSIMRMIHEEDRLAVAAMDDALQPLAEAADEIAARLKNGGRLFYVGAGTSGRIGVLDASELPATYGVSPSLVKAIVPGGYDTLHDARLGDEDDRDGAKTDLQNENLQAGDAVVGIAASGRTPYTHAALCYANDVGAYTVALVNAPSSPMAKDAAKAIVMNTGAEAIGGSTRMKAGTTQKLALNMLSTAIMIRLGKVYRNTMVDLCAVNDKLRARATQLLKELTDASEEQIVSALQACDYHIKTALVALRRDCDVATAKRLLAEHDAPLEDWL